MIQPKVREIRLTIYYRIRDNVRSVFNSSRGVYSNLCDLLAYTNQLLIECSQAAIMSTSPRPFCQRDS